MELKLEDLKIIDKTVKEAPITLHENIPSIPFNLILTGKSRCGKTNLILNMVDFYQRIFKERIIVFTKSSNSSLRKIKGKFYNSLIVDERVIINEIIEFQKQQEEEGKKLKNFLLIFDDFICDSSFQKRQSIFNELYSMGRHSKISVIISSQSFTMTPSTLRRLSFYHIVYKISNQKEKKIMIEELCETIDKSEKEFEEIYNDAVSQKWSFLYLDCNNAKYLTRFGI